MAQLKTKAEEIASEIKKLGNEVMEIYKEHNNAPTGDARKAVSDKKSKMDELHEQYLQEKGWEDGIDGVKAHMDRLEGTGKTRQDFGRSGEGRMVKTIGDIVLEDQAFKTWLADSLKQGGVDGKFRSPSVTSLSLKSLLTGNSDTSAGAFVRRDYDSEVMLPQRPLGIRDLVTIGQTGSDLVEYVRETVRTNNAAPVSEATATAGASGAAPESALAFEQATAEVKDIATWVPATRRALSDVGMLRTLIEGELRYMVAEEFEDQVITGPGTGANFTGIVNTSGIGAQAFDTDILTTTRKAKTAIRVTGRAVPTAFVLHPNDWEDFELLKDSEDRFYWGGPAATMLQELLWRIPVVQNEGVTEGQGIIADFRQVKIWDREQTQIYSTDSHSDFFIRGLNVVLAVYRAAMAVKRPAAVYTIDLTP